MLRRSPVLRVNGRSDAEVDLLVSEQAAGAVGAYKAKTSPPNDTVHLRLSTNLIVRKVKIADMRDNSDMSRIPNPTEQNRERVAKYENPFQS